MARTAAGLPPGTRLTDHISLGVLTAGVPLETAHEVLRGAPGVPVSTRRPVGDLAGADPLLRLEQVGEAVPQVGDRSA